MGGVSRIQFSTAVNSCRPTAEIIGQLVSCVTFLYVPIAIYTRSPIGRYAKPKRTPGLTPGRSDPSELRCRVYSGNPNSGPCQ